MLLDRGINRSQELRCGVCTPVWAAGFSAGILERGEERRWSGGASSQRGGRSASLPCGSAAAVCSASGLGDRGGREKRGERVKPGEGRPEKRTDHGGRGGELAVGPVFLN